MTRAGGILDPRPLPHPVPTSPGPPAVRGPAPVSLGPGAPRGVERTGGAVGGVGGDRVVLVQEGATVTFRPDWLDIVGWAVIALHPFVGAVVLWLENRRSAL